MAKGLFEGREDLYHGQSLSVRGRWSDFFSIYNTLSQQTYMYSFHQSNLPTNSKQASKQSTRIYLHLKDTLKIFHAFAAKYAHHLLCEIEFNI